MQGHHHLQWSVGSLTYNYNTHTSVASGLTSGAPLQSKFGTLHTHVLILADMSQNYTQNYI